MVSNAQYITEHTITSILKQSENPVDNYNKTSHNELQDTFGNINSQTLRHLDEA